MVTTGWGKWARGQRGWSTGPVLGGAGSEARSPAGTGANRSVYFKIMRTGLGSHHKEGTQASDDGHADDPDLIIIRHIHERSH